jgi:hypothetical protein
MSKSAWVIAEAELAIQNLARHIARIPAHL